MIPFPTAFFAGLALILFVVWDAFETIILPRRVTRRFRFTRLFYKNTWRLWKLAARLIPSKKARESLLGLFGPISLLILLGVWALGLIFSFALMHYGEAKDKRSEEHTSELQSHVNLVCRLLL